ncbi:aromatic ring-hydroxylating dioxygenase subunit alpha [Pusillimonas sp. CC-YST705]|uniref:Aromatic ring-hydroxylating dioxygenase subunit alpha n=1 Tax=Mesopusillimonas faecipullorum TaxID=2755040 RepID=A0ABS8CBN9_9BURK|nr:aromatic ring-hydroxylating dioxygenase subunit alpha [Mesopusillimonas faecipullorum]MCB5363403.1 aromatic ring-hydroxylating dioxygenase subunit alpha [Mesopusillimonas faecipullorum]
MNPSLSAAPALATPATDSVAGNERFVRNAWYAGLWASELPVGQLVAQTILNEPVVFYRKEDGAPAAILDRCSHRFAPLSMGKLVAGDRIQCPYHGLEFGPDGKCVNNPHPPCSIPAAAHLPGFQVVEKHSLIWIWMGNKPADPQLIPDYSCLDEGDPLHITDPGYLNIKAHYELIVNNLLDLSHVVYVHDGILGSPGIVQSDVQVETQGEVVTVSRYAKDVAQPSMFTMLAPEGYERGDSFTTISWYAPSNLFLETGTCKTGQPKASGTGYLAIHLLTPETERTTHYRFSAVRWNVMTTGDEHNEQIRRKIYELRNFAFAQQDGPVIEAQQRRMDQARKALAPVLLSIDAGPTRYKRVLDRMLEQDQ